MTIPIKILTGPETVNRQRWSAFIDSHPDGNAYQTPEMYDLFKASDKFDPIVLFAVDNEKNICGLLLGSTIWERSGPAKYLSSRFVVYGGPLVHTQTNVNSGNNPKSKIQNPKLIIELLLQKLIYETQQSSLFIQFRNFFDQREFLHIYQRLGFDYRERMNYIVDTQDEKTVLKKLSSSKRRQINTALRNGAKIIEAENIEQVRNFYDLLFDLYKNKVKKPLPRWSFFENFFKLSSENKLGIIRLIKYKDKIIGGILCPVFNNSTIYEWYVCGLDHEYKKQYPSTLATWAAIDHALKNNIDSFDFMGVGIPEKDYGVREFKARFGGELVNHGRFVRINNKFLYHIAEIGYNLLAIFRRI